MKNKLSIFIVFIIAIVLIQYRFSYSDVQNGKPLKVTTWDAFGYYMYLPGTFIYNDLKDLDWVEAVDERYNLVGGQLYQARAQENGDYVFKYLGGVAVMEAPFFFIGHVIALNSSYEADGFSAPYQYSIAFGAIFYCILAMLLLRYMLLQYFPDRTVALSLLLMALSTNLIQYVSIDSAQSHSFIFLLYAFLLFVTMKWHNEPSIKWAILIGFVIGLATISRPTEAIMIFIPLFWGTQNKEQRRAKWALVRKHRFHLIFVAFFGLVGILPQLIYWKHATGSLIYDVGSKWFFLNPFFRVLFGFTNGWFIYTPITILFIVGMLYIKSFPFKRSVIIFSILNIWIVIAWSDWQYGATYSTRALVQSYPVLILPFAAVIHQILKSKWKILFYLIGAYLVFVNLFQIKQYGNTTLHYRDMNRQYYANIYLDSDPTPLDMSLLDTDEQVKSLKNEHLIYELEGAPIDFRSQFDSVGYFYNSTFDFKNKDNSWVILKAKIKSNQGFTSSKIHLKVFSEEVLKERFIRLSSPICNGHEVNDYEFHFKIPKHSRGVMLSAYIVTSGEYKGEIVELSLVEGDY